MSVGKRIARGSIWLSTGNILATLIAFTGSIVIARILQPEEYGLISIALIFPGMFPGLLDLGLSAAIVRYAPLDRGKGYISTALLIKLITALISGISLYVFADQMAFIIMRPYVAPMIKILSIYVFSLIIIESIKQMLIGLGLYHKSVLLDILKNIMRILSSILLILVGLGVYGAIWGFSIASAVVLMFSVLMIPKEYLKFKFKSEVFRELLVFSLPLYVPAILGLPLNQIVNVFLARRATNFEMGNFSVASNLVIPLGIIGGALAMSLFSSLPLLLERENKLRETVIKAITYTSIIILPISFALIVFSKPAVFLIYGENYGVAPLYLSLLASIGLLAPLGFYVTGPYLNSIGRTDKTMKISLLYYAVYVPLAIVLIVMYGIIGVILSSIVANVVSTLYGVRILRREFGLIVITQRSMRLFTEMSVPAIIVVLMLYLSPFDTIFKMIGGMIVYTIILFFILSLVLRKEEIIELKTISEEIGVIGSVLTKLLNLLLKLLVLQNSIKNRFKKERI